MNHKIPSSHPGELTLLSEQSEQYGTPDNGIFLLSGDASAGQATTLVPGPGVKLPQPSSIMTGNGVQLTIFHINDLHGQLAHLTSEGETPVMSRIAWQLRKQHKAVKDIPNRSVMFFSAGDDLIGSIFDELLLSNQNDFHIHASFHLYSALGMNGACLGNHDFDMGLDLLRKSITKNANYPIFAANLNCPELEGFCHPGAIYIIKGIRVGVIGLVTQAELKTGHPDCVITDPVPVAKSLVKLLRPHCDVLIILSHLGYSLANASVPMVSAGDVELANSLPPGSVDLIIGGHSHHELNAQGLSPKNVINGIPIVQSGSSGRFLGQVDLKVSAHDTAVFQAKLIPVETLPVEAEFEHEMVKPIVSQARSLFDQTLGVTSQAVMTIGDQVTTNCDTGEIPMRNSLQVANFIADALVTRMEKAGMPVDLAMIDSSCVRQNLSPDGPITYGDWFNVMPYADTLRIFNLTGQELLNLVQDNAHRVDLANEPRIERGFLYFSEDLHYTILAAERRGTTRAEEVSFQGQPLTDMLDKPFRVVGTDFVRQYCLAWEQTDLNYQLGHAPDLRHHPYQDTGLFLRRELVAHIKEVSAVTEETGAICDGRIRIIEHEPSTLNNLTVPQFAAHVSQQGHAMAGAVIAASAAQALALGQACLSISGHPEDRLSEIQIDLLELAKQDAAAIARQVAISKGAITRQVEQEKDSRSKLCDLPTKVTRTALEAAQILHDSRATVVEKVRDDLEISIRLLYGTIQAGILLLDSNLRIWPDADLHNEYQPVLDALRQQIKQLSPAESTRPYTTTQSK